MSDRDKLFEIFDKLDIKYDIVEHPAAESTEEADRYIEGKEGARTKNLFMANKKDRQYYLIVMDDQKMISMKDYNKLLDEKECTLFSQKKY